MFFVTYTCTETDVESVTSGHISPTSSSTPTGRKQRKLHTVCNWTVMMYSYLLSHVCFVDESNIVISIDTEQFLLINLNTNWLFYTTCLLSCIMPAGISVYFFYFYLILAKWFPAMVKSTSISAPIRNSVKVKKNRGNTLKKTSHSWMNIVF